MTRASPAPPTSSPSRSSAAEPWLVVGVGSGDRQDDGVGPQVAAALAARGHAAVAFAGEGTGLLDLWAAHPRCIVVDALSADAGSAAAPGDIRVFAELDGPALAAARFVHSTHRIGVPEAVRLARALDRLPKRLVVIGVVGAEFGYGAALSPPVRAAVARLVDRLAGALEAARDGGELDLSELG